jgi:hypothetical protein
MTDQSTALVETALDRRRVGDMKIDKFAGLAFAEYREAIEFAKIMCQARHSIPKYLKQNVGDCLAILTQALRWRLEPYWLAQHSYIARDDEGSLIAYDAAVHAAIILSVANIKGRPHYTYQGEGDQRTCTVEAKFADGGTKPHTYTTPPLAKCRPPRNQSGQVKGSPLWDKDPDQQLGYYAIRNWGRRHCPDVLGGVYDRDEFNTASQEEVLLTANPLGDELPARHEVQLAGKDAAEPKQHAGSAASSHVAEKQHPPETPEKAANASRQTPMSDTEPAQNDDGRPSVEEPQAVQAKKAAPDRFPEPWIQRTGDEYVTYCVDWMSRASSIGDIPRRWAAERPIRNGLGSGSLDEDQLDAIVEARKTAEARIKGAEA